MDRLTRLHKILNQIENQLQSLIEGSTVRLLPYSGNNFNLSLQIVTAMETAVHVDNDGSSIAPNLFTLYVHPLAASTLLENQTLLDELAEIIFLSGTEAGLIFHSPPSIRIKTEPKLKQHQVNIIPEIRSGELDNTTTVMVNIEGIDEKIFPTAFLLVGGDHVYSLIKPVVNIGRRVDNHLVIKDKRVSRLHAQIRLIDNKYVIFDLDSTSGTYVNDNLIQQHILESGDVISLAGVQLVFGQDEFISNESEQDSSETELDSTRPLHPFLEDENSSFNQ